MTKDDAFARMTLRDMALAMTASNRIMFEFLVKAGIDRDEIEAAYRTKAGELIGRQFEDNAANLLRMMSGTVGRKADE